MIIRRNRVWILLTLLGLLTLPSCDSSLIPGRSPSDSIDVPVHLPRGASETYEFDIEVEAITTRGSFSVEMSPLPRLLENDGIVVEQSWSQSGVEEPGWPEHQAVDAGASLVGRVILVLTNEGQSDAEFPLSVIISAEEIAVPAPNAEDIRVEIRRP